MRQNRGQAREKQRVLSLRRLLGFAIGLALLAWLLRQVDLQLTADMLLRTDPGSFLLGCLAYLSTMFFRAYRLVRLTRSPAGQTWNMLTVVLATSLANQILPARLGELAYIYLARRNQNLPIGKGVVSLLIARLLDLLAIGLLFIIGVGLMFDQFPADVRFYVWMAAGIVALVVLLILALMTWQRAICSLLLRILSSPLFDRLPIRQRLIVLVKDIEEGLATLGGWAYYLDLLASSGMVWLSSFGMLFILLKGIGASATFGQTLIGGAFASLTSILPINGIGNFGTQEAGWTAGFVLAGVDSELALTTGFATHLLALTFAIVFGSVAWIWILRTSPTVRDDPQEPGQDSEQSPA